MTNKTKNDAQKYSEPKLFTGADEFLDSVSDSIQDIPHASIEDQLGSFSKEEIAEIDRYIDSTPYRMMCRTPQQRDALRLQLLAPSISNEIINYVDKLLLEQQIRIADEKREYETWLIKQDHLADKKYKELRYRKALDAGLLDDSIRLESGREKVINVSAEKEQLQLANKKNYDLYKANRELEKEISRLKGEKDGI